MLSFLFALYVFLAYIHNVLAQSSRDYASFFAVFQPLCTCFTAPWCRFMARITVLAHRLESWIRMISPNICGLHSVITILTIGHGVSWQVLHPCHLSHSTARILYEVELWIKFFDKLQNVLINRITKFAYSLTGSRLPVKGFFRL